jgi:hypothetical protein
MFKHFKTFNTLNDYISFKNSDEYVKPNLSLIKE